MLRSKLTFESHRFQHVNFYIYAFCISLHAIKNLRYHCCCNDSISQLNHRNHMSLTLVCALNRETSIMKMIILGRAGQNHVHLLVSLAYLIRSLSVHECVTSLETKLFF